MGLFLHANPPNIFIIFSSGWLMKTYETISTEDLFRKTFGHSKFVRFCEVKKMGQSFVLFLTEEA
jgi:hypothetical protein